MNKRGFLKLNKKEPDHLERITNSKQIELEYSRLHINYEGFALLCKAHKSQILLGSHITPYMEETLSSKEP